MSPKYGTICVTGGAGFIGSHLVDKLLNAGYRVVVVDDLSAGNIENIKHNFGKENFRFVNCDVRDRSIKRLVKEVDVIFHEAALTNLEVSINNPLLMNSVNVSGTLNLLDAALGSRIRRFVFASSAAVYGDTPSPQGEDAHTNPISSYGVSKLAAENYVRIFHDTYGLETVSLRYFNVYGSRQSVGSPYSGVIAAFSKRLLTNKPLTIYGDGQQSRDFIHVKDVVEANMLAMKSNDALGRSINVGTGKSLSINELAKALLTIMKNSSARIIHTKERKGDVKHSRAVVNRAKEILGFDCKRTFEREMPKLLKLYRESTNG